MYCAQHLLVEDSDATECCVNIMAAKLRTSSSQLVLDCTYRDYVSNQKLHQDAKQGRGTGPIHILHLICHESAPISLAYFVDNRACNTTRKQYTKLFGPLSYPRSIPTQHFPRQHIEWLSYNLNTCPHVAYMTRAKILVRLARHFHFFVLDHFV